MDIEGQPALRLLCIAQLDDYLRRVKSNLMAEVLMDFPIDMFGHNWEHLDFRGKRINFTSGGDYTKSGPMIRDSLGVIDMSPNTSRAPHERPLRAFGSYTLCLTNKQQFFFDNVAHAADFSFAFDKDDLRQKVADVIAHPARYVEIGAAAAQDFRDKFPPSRFIELLLEVSRRTATCAQWFGTAHTTLFRLAAADARGLARAIIAVLLQPPESRFLKRAILTSLSANMELKLGSSDLWTTLLQNSVVFFEEPFDSFRQSWRRKRKSEPEGSFPA